VLGYFDGLLSFLQHSVDEGFLRREYRSMIAVSPSPSALLDRLASHTAPAVEKWIDREST
jgi:predicted Rossmann-fold nucleotide-binding protein